MTSVATTDRAGWQFLQSGPWDGILCAKHERMVQDVDDYAVEFCRALIWIRTGEGATFYQERAVGLWPDPSLSRRG